MARRPEHATAYAPPRGEQDDEHAIDATATPLASAVGGGGVRPTADVDADRHAGAGAARWR